MGYAPICTRRTAYKVVYTLILCKVRLKDITLLAYLGEVVQRGLYGRFVYFIGIVVFYFLSCIKHSEHSAGHSVKDRQNIYPTLKVIFSVKVFIGIVCRHFRLDITKSCKKMCYNINCPAVAYCFISVIIGYITVCVVIGQSLHSFCFKRSKSSYLVFSYIVKTGLCSSATAVCGLCNALTKSRVYSLSLPAISIIGYLIRVHTPYLIGRLYICNIIIVYKILIVYIAFKYPVYDNALFFRCFFHRNVRPVKTLPVLC